MVTLDGQIVGGIKVTRAVNVSTPLKNATPFTNLIIKKTTDFSKPSE